MRKLSIFGLVFNFLGAAFLSKGLLLTNKQIELLSGTYWEQNLYLKQSLLEGRAWAAVGFVLIGIGFIMQLITVWRGYQRKK